MVLKICQYEYQHKFASYAYVTVTCNIVIVVIIIIIMQILSCMVHRQPTYINYSVHKTRCLVSYSLAVIANTCHLACGFLISTGFQSVSILSSSCP